VIALKRPKALYIEQNKIVLGMLLLRGENMVDDNGLPQQDYVAFLVSGEAEDFYTLARRAEHEGGSVLGYYRKDDQVRSTLVVPFSNAKDIEDTSKELDMKAYPLDSSKNYKLLQILSG